MFHMFIARRATGEWFQGTLDELRIYKRALSAAEVQQNFAAQGLPPQSDVISVAPLGKLAITWGRIKASR